MSQPPPQLLPPGSVYPSTRQPTAEPPPMATGRRLQQSYAMEIPEPPVEHACYEGMMGCLGRFSGAIGSVPCCLCRCLCPNPFKQVEQGRVGLVARFGGWCAAAAAAAGTQLVLIPPPPSFCRNYAHDSQQRE
jgi:hypothetical protein